MGFSVIVLMKNLTRIREVTVKLTQKTTSEIDDKILNKDLIGRAILFIPIIIVSITSTVMDLGDKLISISIPVVLLLVIFSLSNAINEIYKDKDIYKKIPFFAGIQLIKIISLIVVVIVVVATIIGKSPLIILSGLGA